MYHTFSIQISIFRLWWWQGNKKGNTKKKTRKTACVVFSYSLVIAYQNKLKQLRVCLLPFIRSLDDNNEIIIQIYCFLSIKDTVVALVGMWRKVAVLFDVTGDV